jgi:hypothetical protein
MSIKLLSKTISPPAGQREWMHDCCVGGAQQAHHAELRLMHCPVCDSGAKAAASYAHHRCEAGEFRQQTSLPFRATLKVFIE